MHRLPSLILAASCFVLIAVPAIPQTFRPGGNNVVRDSAGQLIGQYDGSVVSDAALVSVVINGYPVYFDVDRNALGLPRGPLYFDQPNCQGTAFLNSNAFIGVLIPAVFAPDGTVRIAPSRTSSTRVMMSWFVDGSSCVNETVAIAAIPTEAGPNMKTRFTPPFTVAPGAVPSVVVDVPASSRLLLGGIFAAVMLIALLRLRS
jgi:hypothetical protein